MKVCLNFSGGKDSTAMLLRLIELGERPDKILFADTLMEFPEMYDYINMIEKRIGQKITRTKPNHNYFEWFFGTFTIGKHKGMMRGFPYVVSPCWYQREAKVVPMTKEQKGYDSILIGYAKGEEKRCMKDKKFRYPLIEWGWTEQDCINYLEKKGVLNPLYKKFKRLGCWICHKQNKESLKVLKRDYPALWNILLQLNKLDEKGFRPNFNKELRKK